LGKHIAISDQRVTVVMHSRRLINDDAALRELDDIIWRTITLVAAIVLLSPIVSNFRIAWNSFYAAVAVAAALIACSWYYRVKRDEPRLSSALGCTAQITIFSAVGAPLSYLAASVNLSLRDEAFDAFDKAVGFDWMSLLWWFNAHPKIFEILRPFYFSMTAQAALIVLCLAFTGRLAWLRVFVLAFVFAATITIAISALLPAQGAWNHYGLHALDPSAVIPATKTFLPVFEGLRDGTFRKLVATGAEGIITFPSLHAALAVILAAAMWPVSGLRWVGLVINTAMLASTPIDGLHYLADIAAGIVIAILSLAASYIVTSSVIADSPLRVVTTRLVPGE